LVLAGLAVAPSAFASAPSGLPVDLELGKTADRASYAPGDVMTYRITIFNGGTTAIPLDRIRVVDPLVANLVPQRNPTVLAPLTSLAYVGTRTATVADCGAVSNTATVSILPPTGNQPPLVDQLPSNDSATVVVNVQGEACVPVTPPVTPPAVIPPPSVNTGGTPAPPPVSPPLKPAPPVCPLPKLSASISGSSFVVAGRVVRYRVTVRNSATNASTRTKATIALPSGFSLVNRPKSITPKGRNLRVAIGTIGGTAERSVLVSLRPDTATAGARRVTVTVTAHCGKTATATARTLVAAIGPRVQPAVTG
jgi:uncharacterized repeat protein (TIGR01451 family)